VTRAVPRQSETREPQQRPGLNAKKQKMQAMMVSSGGYRDQDHRTASGLGLRPGRGDKRHDDSLTTGGCRLHRLKLLSGRSRFS
jgi:hypothetical protein